MSKRSRSRSPLEGRPSFSDMYWNNDGMKGLSVTSKPLASYDKAVTVTRAYVSSIDKCEAAIDKSDSVHLVIQYRSFSGQAMLNADGQIRKWIRRQQRPTANNVCIKVEDKNFVNESKWLVRYVKWCLSEGRHVQQRSILATDSQSVKAFISSSSSSTLPQPVVVVALPMSKALESIAMQLNGKQRPVRISFSKINDSGWRGEMLTGVPADPGHTPLSSRRTSVSSYSNTSSRRPSTSSSDDSDDNQSFVTAFTRLRSASASSERVAMTQVMEAGARQRESSAGRNRSTNGAAGPRRPSLPPSPEQISTGFKVYTMTATQMYAQVDQGGRGKPRPYFYLRYAAHHWKPTQGGYALEGTEQNLLYNDLGQTTRGPRIIYQFGETSASAMQIENFREKIRSKMNAAQIIPGTDSRIGLRIPDSVVRDMVTIPRICSNRSGPALNFTITYGFKVIVFDLRHFALA